MAIVLDNLTRIQKFRRWIGDQEALNVLDQARECTDEEIQDYLDDAVDEINYSLPPQTAYTVADFPSYYILKMGATLQYLVAKGILSARNMITYGDPSGISVQDNDRYGRYVNFYNVLINKYFNALTNFKRELNTNNAYGGLGSELDQGYNRWGGSLNRSG
tara:strand:+ start:370 stop:852 length:483 start_codon:yes stop_codon:yes gene_type:complete